MEFSGFNTQEASDEHERKFPTIRCPECDIQYGGFTGDVAKVCCHCGQGVMTQIFPGDPTYGQRGDTTRGNTQMHDQYAAQQQRR